MNEELHANRKHKDTVFRMLYSDKRAILELYNALNGTDSVSYTHLDVYKRQGMDRRAEYRRAGCGQAGGTGGICISGL